MRIKKVITKDKVYMSSSIRNVWIPVRRRCIFISGPKELTMAKKQLHCTSSAGSRAKSLSNVLFQIVLTVAVVSELSISSSNVLSRSPNSWLNVEESENSRMPEGNKDTNFNRPSIPCFKSPKPLEHKLYSLRYSYTECLIYRFSQA